MAHLELSGISYSLPDGRPLLADVGFRLSAGTVTALIGPNGTGKTTLLRIVTGEVDAEDGAVTRSGTWAWMPQFIGGVRDGSTVRDLLLSVSPEPVRRAAAAVDAAELAMMETDDEPTAMAYAHALAEWADADGYDWENRYDKACVAALGIPYDRAKFRGVDTLSGGEQKRVVLELLLDGPAEVLLLDEPDNYLDVPGKVWLENRLAGTDKAVLLITHDRELLARAATRIVTLEPGVAGAVSWVHGGRLDSYRQARDDRNSRLEELGRRWDEEHAKLKALVQMYKVKAAYNDGLSSRYHAAQTRLAKFVEAGPPQAVPIRQRVLMRLSGGRTAKRAVVCTGLELTGLVRPFDLEIWYGQRLAVLGANGSGKSHFLRLLAQGGSDPDVEHRPVAGAPVEPVRHRGRAVLGSRVRPGWFRQTHSRPELAGRTLLDILHRGDEHRAGMGREQAARALDRYGLARAGEQTFDSLSGGQQARLQILLLELSGATLLLLDEPTDNLDLESAESLEDALAAFEGTVVAVTHDRAFARTFDSFLVFHADASVAESAVPVWDVRRVDRVR
ncbi:ABC-F family ATP-binding cassette domain-containing protein [Nakamurella endophytica]|uniref:ABC transporter ATP-binding protein n=1 Tax=Nakamurella endophytica TaxID=1748367 RepID=A0A917SMY6_9ACTN|nr:ATP-binding cassette domain-containing protein [Nakamurella endophytica]GGL89879.1 putative ABC transporter ATP-binding protein [Nakamurella endophytica]